MGTELDVTPAGAGRKPVPGMRKLKRLAKAILGTSATGSVAQDGKKSMQRIRSDHEKEIRDLRERLRREEEINRRHRGTIEELRAELKERTIGELTSLFDRYTDSR